jgi:hypothetical protein
LLLYEHVKRGTIEPQLAVVNAIAACERSGTSFLGLLEYTFQVNCITQEMADALAHVKEKQDSNQAQWIVTAHPSYAPYLPHAHLAPRSCPAHIKPFTSTRHP